MRTPPSKPEPEHPSMSHYRKGCRCVGCKKENSECQKEWRRRQKSGPRY